MAQVRLVAELLDSRFGKTLTFADEGVVLLDPAVGTGTYPLTAIAEALVRVQQRFGTGALPRTGHWSGRKHPRLRDPDRPLRRRPLASLTQQVIAAGGRLCHPTVPTSIYRYAANRPSPRLLTVTLLHKPICRRAPTRPEGESGDA